MPKPLARLHHKYARLNYDRDSSYPIHITRKPRVQLLRIYAIKPSTLIGNDACLR
jgi:hypothetical protein